MKAILKRFRFSLYFFIAMIVPFIIYSTEEMDGWLAAVVLFIFFPGWVITLVWAIYRLIKDIVRHIGGEPWPEDETIAEIDFIEGVFYFFSDKADEIRDMSRPMLIRYLLFTIGGFLISVAGLALIIVFMVSPLLVGVGTVVLIIGIAIIKLGSPDSYNSISSDIRMHDNVNGMSVEELYNCLKHVRTPFGTVRRAKMIFSKGECLVWEGADGFVVIVYPSKHNEAYYVYATGAHSVKEYLTEAEYDKDELLEKAREAYRKENGLEDDEDAIIVVDDDAFTCRIDGMLAQCLADGEYTEDSIELDGIFTVSRYDEDDEEYDDEDYEDEEYEDEDDEDEEDEEDVDEDDIEDDAEEGDAEDVDDEENIDEENRVPGTADSRA